MSRWRNTFETEPTPWRRRTPLLFGDAWEATKHTIVTPHAVPAGVPLKPADPTEWRRRPSSIFYHTRSSTFAHNATYIRRLPVLVREYWPQHDVGLEVAAARWAAGWSESRYCLVVRGDTPTSHAFYAAIAAACIPVVVSDAFASVALPFRGHIRLTDVAVVVSEQAFLAAPHAVGLKVIELPLAVATRKLAAIARAQRMLIMRHPESTTATHVLQQMAAQLSAPPPQVYVRTPPCDIISERRAAFGKSKYDKCIHSVTYGCSEDRRTMWTDKCHATFLCGGAKVDCARLSRCNCSNPGAAAFGSAR